MSLQLTRLPTRLLRVLLLAAVLALQGCSTVRLAYNSADTLIRWQAGSYFDLHGALLEEFDQRLAAFLLWHRSKALPQYAKFAGEAAVRLERGLTRADIDWIYEGSFAHMREGLRMAASEGAGVLDRLEPANLAHFEQRLAEDNRKFEKEHLRPAMEERRKRRLKRTQERLEDLVGSLSDDQIGLIRRYNERAPLANEMLDRERRRLQGEMLTILRAREARRRLADWAPHWDRNREPAYAAARAQVRADYTDMLLDLDRTLSIEQRRAAAARLRAYVADFQHLAGR